MARLKTKVWRLFYPIIFISLVLLISGCGGTDIRNIDITLPDQPPKTTYNCQIISTVDNHYYQNYPTISLKNIPAEQPFYYQVKITDDHYLSSLSLLVTATDPLDIIKIEGINESILQGKTTLSLDKPLEFVLAIRRNESATHLAGIYIEGIGDGGYFKKHTIFILN